MSARRRRARRRAASFIGLFWSYSLSQFGGAGWLAGFDGRFGVMGVAIFFTISGLLMGRAHPPHRSMAFPRVWIYRRLKSAVDTLDEKKRRRRTNFYAVTFIVASLIGMVV